MGLDRLGSMGSSICIDTALIDPDHKIILIKSAVF